MFLDEPLTDTFRAMPYAETATIGGTAPRHFELLHDLRSTPCCKSETAAVEVKRWGGAIARGDTPAGHRHVPFSVTVDGDDIAPLRPHVTGGSFLNWLKDTSHPRRLHAGRPHAAARAQARLRPDNMFGVGHSLIPAAVELELAA